MPLVWKTLSLTYECPLFLISPKDITDYTFPLLLNEEKVFSLGFCKSHIQQQSELRLLSKLIITKTNFFATKYKNVKPTCYNLPSSTIFDWRPWRGLPYIIQLPIQSTHGMPFPVPVNSPLPSSIVFGFIFYTKCLYNLWKIDHIFKVIVWVHVFWG